MPTRPREALFHFTLVFIERGLPNNLAPNRDFGFMLHGNTQNIRANSWQTQASRVLTGEVNRYRPIVPKTNVDPWRFLDGAWGSVQVAARHRPRAMLPCPPWIAPIASA